MRGGFRRLLASQDLRVHRSELEVDVVAQREDDHHDGHGNAGDHEPVLDGGGGFLVLHQLLQLLEHRSVSLRWWWGSPEPLTIRRLWVPFVLVRLVLTVTYCMPDSISEYHLYRHRYRSFPGVIEWSHLARRPHLLWEQRPL